jgi:glycosyltransferase involved in cell wall biosynthesis
MTRKQLHQVTHSILTGDAVSDHVFLIRRWLRELGYDSDIYAYEWDDNLENEVTKFDVNRMMNGQAVIFHHAMGSHVLQDMYEANIPLILIYHNITPPQFFGGVNIHLTENIFVGRQQLEHIRSTTKLALSDSPYSETELVELGFEPTGVLPIALNPSQYDMAVDEKLLSDIRAKGPMLLFVGRLAPNKRQEDLVKLLYFYKRIEPRAHLVLVGSLQTEQYFSWLKAFIEQLDLSDSVTFTGHVSQQEMITYFKAADIYVSMSEHEGFGKPLIESMYLGLPVMAYASTAVPSTMGNAGVQFRRKDYEALAEMADMIVQEEGLRRRLIAKQKERVQAFLEPNVKWQLKSYLETLETTRSSL